MATEAKGLRVLIVDDEQVIADTLALILRNRGYEVYTAYSGEAAVELAAALRPDVLIADMALGRMSGMDAALEVCRQLPDCRVILVSGQAPAPELLTRASQQGHSFEVLTKPVHPMKLLERLQAYQA